MLALCWKSERIFFLSFYFFNFFSLLCFGSGSLVCSLDGSKPSIEECCHTLSGMAQLLSWGCCFPKSLLTSRDSQGMRSICTYSRINGIFWPGLCSCNFRINPRIWKIKAKFVPTETMSEAPTSTWEVPPKGGWKICSKVLFWRIRLDSF